MPRMEVFKNKKLVLKKVLIRELKNVEIGTLDVEICKLSRLLNQLSVHIFGPLVMKNNGVNIDADGKTTMDYDLLVQAHNFKDFKSAFKPIERLEVSNCIYVRFEGLPEDIQFAHSKLDLYFYENDLEPIGEVYTVIVEESENHTVIDIFKPVKEL